MSDSNEGAFYPTNGESQPPATFTPSLPTAPTAAAGTEMVRAVAEVQGQVLAAQRVPRDERRAMERVQNAAARPGLAAVAAYSYPKGGSNVEGPSIRMAEELARCWGNIQYGWRELERREGESTVQAFAWDLETNTRQVRDFVVPHRMKAKGRMKELTDPRDVYEHLANMAARRMRGCILAQIPGDVIEAAMSTAQKTLAASFKVTEDRLRSTVDAFRPFGVTRAMLEARIGRSWESVTPLQLVQLGSIFNSLRDGMSNPSDWFDLPTLAEKVAAAAAPPVGGAPAAQSHPALEPEGPTPADAPGNEYAPETEGPPPEAPPKEEPRRCLVCHKGRLAAGALVHKTDCAKEEVPCGRCEKPTPAGILGPYKNASGRLIGICPNCEQEIMGPDEG